MNVGGTIREFFAGVSGSTTSSYGQVMGAESSSLTGSDFTPYLQYDFGHIRGPVTASGTFSVGGAMITARCELGGAGVQNAGLAFGGNPSPSVDTCTEEYNGTSWSGGGAIASSTSIGCG